MVTPVSGDETAAQRPAIMELVDIEGSWGERVLLYDCGALVGGMPATEAFCQCRQSHPDGGCGVWGS